MNSDYKINEKALLTFTTGNNQSHAIAVENFKAAVDRTHHIIDQINSYEVDISEILGMRNLSAFIGELFVSCFANISKNVFKKNPHQDGYPDLLLLDKLGKAEWDKLQKSNKLQDKTPFSPFSNGGLEVKATCGAVPTPKQCQKKGLSKPNIGDQRISLMTGYDWKAHHRETNNLIGLVWDFIDKKPRIVGLFFSPNLTEEDWGKIVQPKEGGGRTTSVSIMTREGVKKMYENWVLVKNDQDYTVFFNKKNKSNLL